MNIITIEVRITYKFVIFFSLHFARKTKSNGGFHLLLVEKKERNLYYTHKITTNMRIKIVKVGVNVNGSIELRNWVLII